MSTTSTLISVRIDPDTANASSQITRFFAGLNTQLSSLNSGLSKMGQAMSNAFEAVFGAEVIRTFVKEAASAKQEMAALGAAISASGENADEFAAALARQRDAMKAKTGVDDDELVAVQRMLLTYGVAAGQMEQMTMRTLDLAAAIRSGPVDAARLLGNALAGQAVQVRGLKLELDTTAPRVQQIADFFKQLDKATAGQAVARFREGVPVLQEITNLASDLRKELGGIVIESGVIEALKTLLELFKSMGKPAKELAVYVGLASTGLAALALATPKIQELAQALVALVNALAGGQLITLLGQVKSLADLRAFFTFPEVYRFGSVAAGIAGIVATLMEEWKWLRAVNDEQKAGFALEQRNQDFWNTTNDAITKAGASGAISLEQMRELHAEIRAVELARLAGTVGQLQYTKALVDAQQRLNQLRAPQATESKPVAIAIADTTAISQAQRDSADALRKAQRETLAALLESEYTQRKISDSDYLKAKSAAIERAAAEEKAVVFAQVAQINAEYRRVSQLAFSANDPNSTYDAKQKRLIDLEKQRIELSSKAALVDQDTKQKLIDLDNKAFEIGNKNAQRQLETQNRLIEARRESISLAQSELDANWRLTDDQKQEQRVALLRKQVELEREQLANLKEQAAGYAEASEMRQKLDEQIAEANTKLKQDESQLNTAKSAADPGSLIDQLTLRMVALRQQWGSMAKSMADVISGTLTGAVEGLSSTLAGLAVGTRTFAQAFQSLAQQVIGDLINMTFRALLFRGVLALTGGFFGFADGGAVGAFANGGLINVGTGPRADDVLIRASRKEYIQPADAVEYYGVPFMDALRRKAIDIRDLAYAIPRGISRPNTSGRYADGGLVTGGVAGGNVKVMPAPVNIAVLNSTQALREFMEKHGNAIAFDYISRNKHKLGLRS